MKRLDESLLTALPPFSRLERSEIRAVLDRATPAHLPARSALFEEGASAERFFLLLDGQVRVERMSPEGERIIVLHVPPGQLLGIARALGRDTYPASAIAAVDCVALSWPISAWDELSRHEGFASATSRTVGERMGEVQSRMMELATLHVEQRVARAVLRLMQQTGRRNGDAIEIAMPLTRQDISEMTGTTLHTVSRLMSAWEREGIVSSARRRVEVRAPHRLVEIAERPS